MPIGPGYADSLQMLAGYASRPGFDAQIGMSLLGMIEQNKATAIAQRQARLQQLNEVISGAAMQGAPYDTTQMLAEGLPGPMGPAGDAMMAGYYPPNEFAGALTSGMGAVTGAVEAATGAVAPPPPSVAPSTYSPAYQSDPVAQLKAQQAQYQMGLNEAAAGQGMPLPFAGAEMSGGDVDNAAGWQVFQEAMAAAKAKGIPPDQAYAMFIQASPDNGALVATDANRARTIQGLIYGSVAMSVAGAPGQPGA